MRKKIIAGNWKMNLDLSTGKALASEVVNIAQDELGADVQLVLCTPAIHLAGVSPLVANSSRVALGAQNIQNMKRVPTQVIFQLK
jgi:triosephosphate isomerase